jgi:hypothetical protein
MHMALAGPIAEAKAQNKPLRQIGNGPDLLHCRALSRSLYDYWRALPSAARIPWPGGRIINHTRDKVRRWVGRPRTWGLILGVAEELSVSGCLNAEQLAAILGREQSQTWRRGSVG